MKHTIHLRKYLLCTLVVVGVFLALSLAAKYFAEQNSIRAAAISTGKYRSPKWTSTCVEGVTAASPANATALTAARTRVSNCAVELKRDCTYGSPMGAPTVGTQTETSVTYSYHMWPFNQIFYSVMTTITQEVKCDYLPGYLEWVTRNARLGMPVPAPSGMPAMPVPTMP